MNDLFQIMDILRMALDIVLVWVVIHYLLKVFKNNAKTMQIMKGVIFVFIAKFIAELLKLTTFNYFLNFVLNWGFLAIVVIFQPEIRELLEKMGNQANRPLMLDLSTRQKQHLINELVLASKILSSNQTGALITIQRTHSLDSYVKNATIINSVVSKELLTSIFVTSTPLHDGAVIIQGDKIACASAYYQPTSQPVALRYGARHRAALGISEVSDSVTIVISEETGQISVAEHGKILKFDNSQQLSDYLVQVINVFVEDKSNPALNFLRNLSNVNWIDRSDQSVSQLSNSNMRKVEDEISNMKLPKKYKKVKENKKVKEEGNNDE